MLSLVQVYSSQPSASALTFDTDGSAETDPIQVRDISGLDPVESTVNTTPLGFVDGDAYIGTTVPSRNIVLTLGPNPDYVTWEIGTVDRLRQFIYSYFMPRTTVKLLFVIDEDYGTTAEIEGVVESVMANAFSEDPEFIISIICVDPYFTATSDVVTLSTINDPDITVLNSGNIPIGALLEVDYTADVGPVSVQVKVHNSLTVSYFYVDEAETDNVYLEISSRSRDKFVREINMGSGIITNRIKGIRGGSAWTILQPGNNQISIDVPGATGAWQITFREKYGGL